MTLTAFKSEIEVTVLEETSGSIPCELCTSPTPAIWFGLRLCCAPNGEFLCDNHKKIWVRDVERDPTHYRCKFCDWRYLTVDSVAWEPVTK